jgi:hypothetical protein
MILHNRERSSAEKKRTETADQMLKITLKLLAKRYCMLILGLNAVEYHHMNCGRFALFKNFYYI